MPLDVKPLSPVRRVVMILVMLALLALSLGFAQWLIAHPKTAAGPEVVVRFLPVGDLKQMPVNTAPDGDTQAQFAEVTLPQGKRALLAFDFHSDNEAVQEGYLELLSYLALPEGERDGVRANVHVGGFLGVESTYESSGDTAPAFAIIRLAQVGDHVVAFCLSGEGQITDADRQFVEEYCVQRIDIRVVHTRKG
jgi:hypothetical protein